jgi:NAD(P)-dependent dehydrogenase (short-subunit alcohol dehydrogenase family)
MPSNDQGHALLVGASRGLGAGLVDAMTARGWRVTATVRDPARAAKTLAEAVEQVDIDVPEQVAALHARLNGQLFDLVFVVAGVSTGNPATPIHQERPEEALRVYRTNALSPIAFAEAFVDRLTPSGMIAFMSSTLGSVTRNTNGGYDAYRASKAALNMLARSFAARHPALGVLIVHPGWVRTDMGGPNAPLDVATSTEAMATMLAARRGLRGTAYVDWENNEIPW